jgi:uncharacterized membrane protein
MTDIETRSGLAVPTQGLITLTHVMYALHGFSGLMGLLSSGFIVMAFLTGWPSIIAVIINYVKRGEATGTFLESHFRWQLQTFWYAVIGVAICAVLFVTLIGIPLAWLLAVIVGIWVLYRIIRGWLALADRKPMVT